MDFQEPGEASSSPGGNSQLLKPKFFNCFFAFLDLNPDTATFYIVPYTYQCCGSGMSIRDLDFYPSRILDLGSQIQQQKRREKKTLV
jgi:hypothetical protein